MDEMPIVGIPSTAQYWHIGETTIRLRSVTPRMRERREQIGLRQVPIVIGIGHAAGMMGGSVELRSGNPHMGR